MSKLKKGCVPNIRNVVHCVPGVMEVVEIEWPKASRSKKHDHGRSHGFTRVLEGDVYVAEKGVYTIYHPGDTFTENPDTVHAVGSVYGAKTLHFYSPPITGTMTVFPDEEDDDVSRDS